MRAVIAALVLVAGAGQARADRSVAFVNVSEDTEAGRKAIETLRADLAANQDWSAAASNDALEGQRQPEAAVEPSFLDGVRAAYRKVDTKSALRQLDEVEHDLRSRTPSEDVFEALSQAAFLRGKVLATAEQANDAVDAFTLAYRLRPNSDKLDPKRFPPKVRKLYDKAVARTSADRSPLVVATEPRGANVWVNGVAAGVAPVDINVAPGAHYITAHRAGFAPATVVYRGGKRFEVKLRALEGNDQLRSLRAALVSGADVGALASLAERLDVARVVLVRAGPNGADAASYDAESGKLGEWRPARANILFPAAPAGATDLGTRDRAPKPKKWYQKTWGKAAIAGGVLVGALIVVAVVTSGGESDSDPGYELGGFEWVF